jgi:hypothetical protein
MKAFWWQAGLHLEPETDGERSALALVYESLKKTDIRSDSAGAEQLAHGVVGYFQLDPSSIRTDFLNE